MDEFLRRWQFVRSETLELLGSLEDEQLQFRPEGEQWQPLYCQFGCIGRTQLVYAESARTGKMSFELFSTSDLPAKDANQTGSSIRQFLESTDQKWVEALTNNQQGVEWPDGKKSAELHVLALAEHERLHHGQLISYFTFAGFELPADFKRNWAL